MVEAEPLVSHLAQYFSQWAMQTPIMLVLGVGVVMAFVRWRNHPRASLLAMSGLVGLILLGLIFPIIQTELVMSMPGPAPPPQNIARRMMVLATVGSCLRAVGYGLVVAAIFADRPPSRSAAAG
jgi:hypothetical protein